MSWLNLAALGAGLVLAAAIVALMSRAMRKRLEPITLEIDSRETCVFNSDRVLLFAVANTVTLEEVSGSSKEVGFGDPLDAGPDKGTEVVNLVAEVGRASALWRSFIGYVLLRAVKESPKRIWGLRVKIALDLPDEAADAFRDGVTDKSMKALGTVEFV